MDPIQLANIRRIQEAARSGRLVLFVGAGISANSGVPMWGALIDKMREELPESVRNEKDDLKVAQLYKDSRRHKEYMEMVMNVLCHNKVIPNPIHKAILALNPVHIITTNYDDLLEQEIRDEYKQFAVVRCDKDLPNISYPNVLVKMHGDYSRCNIVLAENDYYNYGKDFALTKAFVQSLFASKLVVFVGFSFADLNLKMIINEVKNILDERMQPVYLLSLEQPDQVTFKYFDNKGINIVYLDDSEVSELKSKNCALRTQEKTLNKFGKKLYDYLDIIRSYDFETKDDLISYVYGKISKYQDEIRVIGSGLKYFFPEYDGEHYFNEHSGGLQTFIKYFETLAEDLKSLQAKREFVRRHPRHIRIEYAKIAYYNFLYRIDGLKVLGTQFENNIDKYIPSTVSDYLECFDFDAFNRRLKELSSRKLDGTINDMEYPYAFYKVGAYYKSYKEFERILPMAWKRQKYVLYFLCLYNMKSLRYAIKSELSFYSQEPVDWKPIYDRLSGIDLNDVLNKLPLPIEMKRIFQDLLSYRYIGTRVVESGELKEKVHQQRKQAERGGFSINSNIYSLIGKYEREKQFATDNFILSDFNNYYKALCRNAISGILNSYATRDEHEDREYFSNTRIESMNEQFLRILIFGVDNSDLRDMFRQYDIYEISLSEDGQNFLNQCYNNLSSGSFTKYGTRHIKESIKNLLYLTARCETCEVNTEVVYKIVNILWRSDTQRFEMKKFLHILLETHNPSIEFAHKFLIEILDEKNGHNYEDIVDSLCRILSAGKEMIPNIESYLTNGIHDTYLLSLYYVCNEKDKAKLVNYGKEQFKHRFPVYIEFISQTNSMPISKDDFKHRLEEDHDRNIGNHAIACKYMAEWRKNEKYSSYWTVIDDQIANDKCLKFFMDPLVYPCPDEVDLIWIRVADDETIKALMSIPAYYSKFQNFVNDSKFNPKIKRVINRIVYSCRPNGNL